MATSASAPTTGDAVKNPSSSEGGKHATSDDEEEQLLDIWENKFHFVRGEVCQNDGCSRKAPANGNGVCICCLKTHTGTAAVDGGKAMTNASTNATLVSSGCDADATGKAGVTVESDDVTDRDSGCPRLPQKQTILSPDSDEDDDGYMSPHGRTDLMLPVGGYPRFNKPFSWGTPVDSGKAAAVVNDSSDYGSGDESDNVPEPFRKHNHFVQRDR